MFYKFENNEWLRGYTIYLPSGIFYDENNKTDITDGWEWFDEEPAEYIEWVELNYPISNNNI